MIWITKLLKIKFQKIYPSKPRKMNYIKNIEVRTTSKNKVIIILSLEELEKINKNIGNRDRKLDNWIYQ